MRPTRRHRSALSPAVAALASVAACASLPPPGTLRVEDEVIELCENGAPSEEVLLSYLGTGGFLLRYRDAALMTAPFYSNPGVLRVGLGFTLEADPERIDALLPSREELAAVRGVLVGHAHYDHAMDLPRILERLPGVRVYGNDTLSHLLAPELPADLRVSLNDQAAGRTYRGEWRNVPGSPFRILAIRSDHGAQVAGMFSVFHGAVDRADRAPPRSAYGWKGGMTLAYLIDVLRDDGSVALRLHYQDAASHYPMGAPPPSESGSEDPPVDVAILCVGAFAGVDDYPQALLAKLHPRHLVLGHWEDFFRDPRLRPSKVVRGTDLPGFFERLEPAIANGSTWTLPDRDVTLRFRTCLAGPE